MLCIAAPTGEVAPELPAKARDKRTVTKMKSTTSCEDLTDLVRGYGYTSDKLSIVWSYLHLLSLCFSSVVIKQEDWNNYENAIFAHDLLQSLEASADHLSVSLLQCLSIVVELSALAAISIHSLDACNWEGQYEWQSGQRTHLLSGRRYRVWLAATLSHCDNDGLSVTVTMTVSL